MSNIEPGSQEWEVARNRAGLRSFTPEIMLTPANQALKAAFVNGMQAALFDPTSAAITAEAIDTTDNFDLNHTKFLARVAFLHLENSTAADANRPFDLAVGVYALHIDLETIRGLSEDELKDFGYDSFDGVYIKLFDTLLGNHVSKSLHHGSRNSRYGFQFYESGSGYAYIPGQTEDIVGSAYQIDTRYGFGTSRKPALGTHLEELQVIAEVLENGEPDQTAVDNVVMASEVGDAITLIADDASETGRVMSHLYGIFKGAVEAADLRDTLAGHQYWHVQEPDYLIR
jgi:hypothetical protein